MTAITRRDVLRGVTLGAGAPLLAPLLTALEAQAAGPPAAGAAQPLRFVFVLEGNGMNWNHIQPVGAGAGYRKSPSGAPLPPNGLDDKPLADFKLPMCLEPLEAFKKRLTVIQGLSGRICGGGHSNNFGALGCYPGKGGAVSGETVDAALAKARPGIFPHVGLGMVDKSGEAVVYNVSASKAGAPLPTQVRPDGAHKALFGSVAAGAGKAAFTADSNVLDFMAADLKRVEGRLAGPEREKFQRHVAAYEAMQDRQSRLNEIEVTLRKHAPAATNKYTSAVETDRLDAMFDLAAGALAGGLTNVVTLSSGSGDPYFGVKFGGLGVTIGKHGLGHGGGEGGKTSDEITQMIRRFHIDLIARLAKKLDAIPEGGGTMLDNTVIVYTSDSAESHHSRCSHWPLFVLGDAGGRLKTAGRYLCYPEYGAKGHRTTANFFLSLLHAAGAKRDTFGVADPQLKDIDQKGPLSELMA